MILSIGQVLLSDDVLGSQDFISAEIIGEQCVIHLLFHNTHIIAFLHADPSREIPERLISQQ